MKRRRIATCLMVGIVAVGLVAIGASAKVLISEVAWAGTAASAQDEWIELLNVGDTAVDLTGWTLRIDGSVIHFDEATDATLEIRRTTIEPGGFFLLERTDDTVVSDVEADLIYKGSLSNGGEDLFLVDGEGEIVDQILAAEPGWPGGLGRGEAIPYATMERFHPPFDGLTWGTNAGTSASTGLDADGSPLNGTPRATNSTVELAASAPRVEVTAPTDGTVSGPVVVEWSAIDPDGDDAALRLSIILSREETTSADAPGETLAENLANTGSFAWDSTRCEDGTYYVFVVAEDADGHRVAERSGAIEVRNGD